MKANWTLLSATSLLRHSDTLRDALQRMNAVASGILLLIDSHGVLMRSVTDGDLRRLILAGKSLDDTLEALPKQQPVTSLEKTSTQDLLAQMNLNGINHIIIIDEHCKPIAVAARQDIDTSILLSTPHLGDEEKGFVAQAFNTNWIAPVGPNIDAFEQALADKVGVKYAVAVSSGTAAIHLALRVLNVGKGDTVFCSSFTFVASVNPIIYQGAEPVFIDSEPESWNMSPQALKRALLKADAKGCLPKAVIVVSLYGQSADMDPILELCNQFGVAVIEDAAESLGATYKGKVSGTLGKIGIYSFNGNKIITTSGGGMIVTNDEALATKAKFLSTQARESTAWYEHKEIGYNYRMSNILAGIGRGQLKVLDDRVNARRKVFENYQELFADYPVIQWMPEAGFGRPNRWLSTFTFANGAKVDIFNVAEKMLKENIEVRPLWKPMHQQPVFAYSQYYEHEPGYSVCDDLFSRGLCLPSGSNMSVEQQARVVKTLLHILDI